MEKCIRVDCYGDIFITSESDNKCVVKNKDGQFLFSICESGCGFAAVKESNLCECEIFKNDVMRHLFRVAAKEDTTKYGIDGFLTGVSSGLATLPNLRNKYRKDMD